MKLTTLFSLCFLSSTFAAAQSTSAVKASDIPADYKLQCRDGTFNYNNMIVQTQGDQLNFEISGRTLSRTPALNMASADGHQLQGAFLIPLASCKTSLADAKILTCHQDTLEIRVTNISANNVVKKAVLQRAVVQVRKVEELAVWQDSSLGYELKISDDGLSIFQQAYIGFAGDATNNCELK